MTVEELADIHARAMTVPRPWGVPTLRGFLEARGAILATSGRGFALGRVIADEAELLTIAVDPADRRQGHARRCLTLFEAKAVAAGARKVHLEVAATNEAAISLYRSAGYIEVGLRPDYYDVPGGGKIDALVLTRSPDFA